MFGRRKKKRDSCYSYGDCADLRVARPVSTQYRIAGESHGIYKYGKVYKVKIAGDWEYLPPSRKIVWRDSYYGWSKYDPRKRGKQNKRR